MVKQAKNLHREISMAYVRGYKELTMKQKDIFDQYYKQHLSSMAFDSRQDYTESHLVEVRLHQLNNGFYAFFDNDTVFRYTASGITFVAKSGIGS